MSVAFLGGASESTARPKLTWVVVRQPLTVVDSHVLGLPQCSEILVIYVVMVSLSVVEFYFFVRDSEVPHFWLCFLLSTNTQIAFDKFWTLRTFSFREFRNGLVHLVRLQLWKNGRLSANRPFRLNLSVRVDLNILLEVLNQQLDVVKVISKVVKFLAVLGADDDLLNIWESKWIVFFKNVFRFACGDKWLGHLINSG